MPLIVAQPRVFSHAPLHKTRDGIALARLLEAIRQGGAAVVVVSGLDRLARDRAQGVFLFEEFKAAGVSITTTGS
jgi:DNA invertase Pin-like site-specific DNA recombinase